MHNDFWHIFFYISLKEKGSGKYIIFRRHGLPHPIKGFEASPCR